MSALVRAWCTCGWHGEYDTSARADYARRRHSCAKHERERARARRGAELRRTVDRTERPCEHKVARHEHGTRAAFVLDRCRCDACRAANRAYEADRLRRNAYGRSNLVDAGPVREHVAALGAAGMGLKTVAARAGVASGTLWKLVYGRPGRAPSRRVTRSTADALLAVTADLAALAGGARVDATGSARRVRALVARGWSVTRITATSGLDRQCLDPLLTGTGTRVTAAHARAVRDLYDELWDVAPPEATAHEKAAAARSRNRAAAAGWVPPAAWDDDTIDDPAALPAPGWRDGECAEPGRPARPELTGLCRAHYDHRYRGTRREHQSSLLALDEWLHLVRSGEDHERAARRVGVTLVTVEHWARQWGRDDVQRRLDAARAEALEARTHVVPTAVLGARRRTRSGRAA